MTGPLREQPSTTRDGRETEEEKEIVFVIVFIIVTKISLVGGVLIFRTLNPPVDRPIQQSVTHGQCDARPTVTFSTAQHCL